MIGLRAAGGGLLQPGLRLTTGTGSEDRGPSRPSKFRTMFSTACDCCPPAQRSVNIANVAMGTVADVSAAAGAAKIVISTTMTAAAGLTLARRCGPEPIRVRGRDSSDIAI